MSFHLFWPDADALETAGFRDVADVPAIFRGDWEYEVRSSKYLRDRATLKHSRTDPKGPVLRFIGRSTLQVYGQSLCNFLEWAEVRHLDVRTLDYASGLVDGYQADMLSGEWSAKRRPLGARTVNLRVGVANDFLIWLAAKGHRDPYRPIVRTVTKVRHASRSSQPVKTEVTQRAGMVRASPLDLRMPSDEEVKRWRNEVRIRRGAVKLLMIDLVLQTGVRREEVAQWRVDTLPIETAAWRVYGSTVTVRILYGTKGAKRPAAGGSVEGPARYIDLPIALAERIDSYRRLQRPAARAKFVGAAGSVSEKRARMKADCGRLFLSPHTGLPISAASLYEAWTCTASSPFVGWSPHLGRHYFSCKTLLDRLLQYQKGGTTTPLIGAAEDVIRMVLKPQLGHVDERTTQAYLRWLERLFLAADHMVAYVESLDSLCEEANGGTDQKGPAN